MIVLDDSDFWIFFTKLLTQLNTSLSLKYSTNLALVASFRRTKRNLLALHCYGNSLIKSGMSHLSLFLFATQLLSFFVSN